MNIFVPSLIDKTGISNTENYATEVMVTDLIILHSIVKNCNPNYTLIGKRVGKNGGLMRIDHDCEYILHMAG